MSEVNSGKIINYMYLLKTRDELIWRNENGGLSCVVVALGAPSHNQPSRHMGPKPLHTLHIHIEIHNPTPGLIMRRSSTQMYLFSPFSFNEFNSLPKNLIDY